jgi:inner membrane protein
LDSLTQLTLGAAVGEAVLGRQIGRRALLWGGICGTLPDLDVLIPLASPVMDFTYHRSASHSLFVLALLTPLMVWLILKFHPRTASHKARWFVLVYLVFATHVLLDSFTVYGTQIFWPFDTTPVGWSTVFIIDPLYTVPLLVGAIAALIASRTVAWGYRLNLLGLLLSTAYLAWSVGAKMQVEHVAQASLARQGVQYEKLLTTPAPFNTLLWRVLAMKEDGYYEGFYSLLDERPVVQLKFYPSRLDLLRGIEDHWPVRRLQWFTKGFFSVDRLGDGIVMSDLRMGIEPDYVFRFKVAEISNPHAVPVTSVRVPVARSLDRLPWLWGRIWGRNEGQVGRLAIDGN